MSVFVRCQQLLLCGCLITFFPFTVACLIFNYACNILLSQKTPRQRIRRIPAFKPKTILVTGVNSPQGLRIARAFYETGHRVIGADTQASFVPIYARFSRSLHRFHKIQNKPFNGDTASYAEEILSVVQKEKVEIWISCFDNAYFAIESQAKRIIEQTTNCSAFILDVEEAANFRNRDGILQHIQSLGLPVPETYLVKSRGDIHKVLNHSRGKRQYTLSNSTETKTTASNKLLPRRTLSQTYHEVSNLKIDPSSPMILKQHLEGLKTYNTMSIVVKGSVQLYAATYESGTGCAETLATSSALNQAMLEFLQALAAKLGPHFSSHLFVRFGVEERVTQSGVELILLPVDGSVAAQPSLALFKGINGSVMLSRAYLSILSSKDNGTQHQSESQPTLRIQDVSMPSQNDRGVYVFGLVAPQLILIPLLRLFTLRMKPLQFYERVTKFLEHLLFWQESLYDISDPLPVWWFYQVYCLMELLMSAVFGQTQNTKVL